MADESDVTDGPTGADHDWPVLESAVEYETGWYDGGYDLVEQPDGSTKRYYWADLPPAVVVVALDGDDVLFVDQYRATIRTQCLELPAGIVEEVGVGEAGDDAGRTPAGERPGPGHEPWVDAAARELREETGFVAEDFTLLQTIDVATGVLRHERAVVVAEGLTEAERDLDDNEFLTVERVPAAEAISVARADPANDATLEGVLLAAADGYL